MLKPGISYRSLSRPETADFLRDGPPMRGRKGGQGLYRQTEVNAATQRSPTSGNTHGDRGPVVVSGRESRLQGEGDQNTGFRKVRGFRMEDKALTRLEAIRRRNAERTWINSDLYRLLYKPDLYEVAYERIKSNPGNMTAGVDRTTLDGFSRDTVAGIIHRLQDESFQFKPAKRVFIPKANGKMRPLGIPRPADKVVQEAMHIILEAIYDSPYGAYFHDCSHGFRPGRSCHTALRVFRNEWKGTTWILEGDIKACFDEIDQKTLLTLLGKKVADGRFLNLIGKSLKVGYLWKKEHHTPTVGSPQGSTLSPLLANIYLHELDEFVLGLKKRWETGKCRKPNPEYNRLSLRRRRLLRKSGGEWTDEVVELTKRLRALPSLDTQDAGYIRVKYLRYADDWIVGITGPRELADQARDQIGRFLKDELKLQLSLDKTRITHAKTEEAIFLGTRLSVGGDPGRSEAKIATTSNASGILFRKRTTGWLPKLKAPVRKLVERLHTKGFCKADGTPTSKGAWTPIDPNQIIGLYNSILWGLLNYYRFADNFGKMNRIQYILRFSLAKTLAHKYETSMKQVFRKYGRNLEFRWTTAQGEEKAVAFRENTAWTRRPDAFSIRPPDLDLLGWHRSLRSKSKLGYPCLICGIEGRVQMHHVRHIRKMGAKKLQGFTAVMGVLNRKQVPVCEACHQKIHRGEYDGIKLGDLAYEFAARKPE